MGTSVHSNPPVRSGSRVLALGLGVAGGLWGLVSAAPAPPPNNQFMVGQPTNINAVALDWPGLDQACPGAHARDVRWSPDGKRIAVDREDNKAHSLCILLMTQENPSSSLTRVKASRLTSVTQASGSQSKAQERINKERQISEWELEWAPSQPESAPVYPAAAVFTVQRAQAPMRLFGVEGASVGSGAVVPLDGRSAVISDGYDVYQAAWRPLKEGEKEAGITAVSDADLKCGKSRIVYIPVARCLDAECKARPTLLTTPCAPPAAEKANVADRYPSWDPVASHDRLSFVRSNPGHSEQVCILTGPLSLQPKLHCFESEKESVAVNRNYPVWSSDGRYLAYYEYHTSKDATKTQSAEQSEASVKVIDLQSDTCTRGMATPGCGPKVVFKGIVPNSHHGPTITTYGGKTLVFGIKRTDEARSVVVGRSLGTVDDTRQLDPHLENIKSLDVVVSANVVKLVMVAQGHRDVRDADQTRDKVFYFRVPSEWW